MGGGGLQSKPWHGSAQAETQGRLAALCGENFTEESGCRLLLPQEAEHQQAVSSRICTGPVPGAGRDQCTAVATASCCVPYKGCRVEGKPDLESGIDVSWNRFSPMNAVWSFSAPEVCSAPRPSPGRCFSAPRAPRAPAPLPTLAWAARVLSRQLPVRPGRSSRRTFPMAAM